MATYNRGRHIVPSIRSVLDQSFSDYELLIVGDNCTDDTAAIVRPFLADRVKWTNLPERSGSQAGPNNAGIALARGRYVAYLGHDDLWSPGHLAALHRTFEAHPEVSFGVSGCICYGPPGSGHHLVTGLFDSDDAKFSYFFPPSSFAHCADVIAKIGPWGIPEALRRPVDADLLLRGAEAGLKFVSTGEITVHKFAAGGRYLSYARHESDEQAVIARMMREPGFGNFVADVVARARAINTVGLRYPDYTKAPVGFFSAQLRASKGILRPPLMPLDGRAVMPQSDEVRSLDWHPLSFAGGQRFRWSGPNPRPRMLIPFSASGETRLRCVVCDASDDNVIEKIRVTVNGTPVSLQIQRRDGSRRGILQCAATLPASDHTVVMFDLTGGAPLEQLVRCVTGRPERIALGEVGLKPTTLDGRSAPRSGWRPLMARLVRRLTKR